jgi:hypothetical protein
MATHAPPHRFSSAAHSVGTSPLPASPPSPPPPPPAAAPPSAALPPELAPAARAPAVPAAPPVADVPAAPPVAGVPAAPPVAGVPAAPPVPPCPPFAAGGWLSSVQLATGSRASDSSSSAWMVFFMTSLLLSRNLGLLERPADKPPGSGLIDVPGQGAPVRTHEPRPSVATMMGQRASAQRRYQSLHVPQPTTAQVRALSHGPPGRPSPNRARRRLRSSAVRRVVVAASVKGVA